MVTFHKSRLHTMDSQHYYVTKDDNDTMGDVLNAALEQIINPFKKDSGFEPAKIHVAVEARSYGGSSKVYTDTDFPEELRKKPACRVEMIHCYSVEPTFGLQIYEQCP